MRIKFKILQALGFKAIICGYCAVGLLFSYFTQTAIAADAPELFVAEPFLDGGKVREGAPALLTFRLANQGTEPLIIRKIGHSAGCFVKAYAKEIAPGKNGEVRVGLETKGKAGKIEGSFFLYSNDPHALRFPLRVAATVVPFISIVPDRVYFSGFADETYKTSIIIRSNMERPLKIKSITCSIENQIKYRIKTINAGKIYRLDVSAKPPPGSYFRGRLTLETTYTEKPEIIIPVLGRILQDVEVMPSALNFGIRFKKDYVKPDAKERVRLRDWRENWHKLPMTLFLRVNRGEAIHIKEIILENPFFKKDYKVLRDGRLYRIKITPLIDQMPPGKHTALLRIHTDNRKYKIFDISIQVTVK